MTALRRERLPETILLAAWLFTGSLLIQGVAWGENGGCTNNICKEINIWRTCKDNKDYVRKYITCVTCKMGGRCDGGTTRNCTERTTVQKKQTITTTEICDCAKAPNAGVAERTGTYVDDGWTDLTTKQWLCADS
jgi:hypothetical protein